MGPHRDIGDYDNPGFDDLTMSLAFLPDLKTESTTPSGLSEFLPQQAGYPRQRHRGLYATRLSGLTGSANGCATTVLTVSRVDTAKHVEMAAPQQLKAQSIEALAEWKKANPQKRFLTQRRSDDWRSLGTRRARERVPTATVLILINFDYQDQAAKARLPGQYRHDLAADGRAAP